MQETVLKQTPLEKLSERALQAQMKVYQLQEWLMIGGAILLAGGLRVAMQGLPNIEPITFMALLGGALFGRYKGMLVGASAVWWSNFFVFGGQGPWSILQVVAFGGVGLLGGFLPKKFNIAHAAVWTVIATAWFEIVMNVGWAGLFGINPLIIFMTGLPMFLWHIGSNVGFSAGLPYLRGKVHELGKFEDRELCRHLLARVSSRARILRKH